MSITVISHKYIPSNLPLWSTITLWLLLDRLQPPGWVLGVVWTLWGIVVIATLYRIYASKHVHPRDLPEETS